MPIDDRWKVNDLRVIFLTSDDISVAVIPDLGGCITSIRHLPSNTELLSNIREPRTVDYYRGGLPAENLMELSMIGGWYEILPNAGYRSNYEGIDFGLHDEAAYLPWRAEFDSERDADSLLLKVSLNKFPLVLSRRMTLLKNKLTFDERLVNESPVELPVSWLHHPLFGSGIIGTETELKLPESTFVVDDYLNTGNNQLKPGQKGKWPDALSTSGEHIDLSRFPEKGSMNFDDLVYIPHIGEGWFKLINERKRISFYAQWDSEIFKSLWIWRPFGGGSSPPWFGTIYGAGIEIATSWPATGLSEQISNGSAFRLKPYGSVSTQLQFTIDQF